MIRFLLKREVIGWIVISTLIIVATVDSYQRNVDHTIVYIAEAHVEEEPEEVLIEVKIDWTTERIEKEIRDTFSEDPETAVKVAKCESGLKANAKGPTQDAGIFQIHLPSHQKTLDSLGIDVWDVKDNIEFAHRLYQQSGWNPWVCYTKNMLK